MAKGKGKTGKGKGGVELIKFKNFVFEIKPDKIQSFNQWSITGQTNTEDKETDGQKYVSKKTRGTAEMEITAVLNYFAGADVKETVLDMVEAANEGKEDFVYLCGKKLFTYKMMLTKAQAKDIRLAPNGEMIYAEVALSFRQSTKKNGGTDPDGGKDKPQGTGNKKYTCVCIINGSTVTRITYAKSEQEAVTKLFGSNYTGWMGINGNRRYVLNGKITTYPGEDATKPQDEGKEDDPSAEDEWGRWQKPPTTPEPKKPAPKNPPKGGTGPHVAPDDE